MKTYKKQWMVEYNYQNGCFMEFRYFDSETEANEFAKTVDGNVDEIVWYRW